MYKFSKIGGCGGLLINTTIKGGGGGRNKTTEQEIVPLGLVFIDKKPINKKKQETTSIEVFNDKSWNKLYKKVKHSKSKH